MALAKGKKDKKGKEEQKPIRRLPESTKHGGHENEEQWLVSYADMMTLLCGFFIMMFSMAKLDEPKFEAVKQEVAKAFGGEYVPPSTQGLSKLADKMIKDLGIEKQATLKADAFGITIAFQSTIFFDTLSSEVRDEGKKVLLQLIDEISKYQTKEKKVYRIVVEGHTDARPITAGFFPSNWELSGARAARVIRMFLDRGFDAKKLHSIGYADTYPLFPSRKPTGEWDDQALGKNRRVVLRILEPKVDGIPFPETPETNPFPLAAASPTPSVSPIQRQPAATTSPIPTPSMSLAPLPHQASTPSPVSTLVPTGIATPSPLPTVTPSATFSPAPISTQSAALGTAPNPVSSPIPSTVPSATPSLSASSNQISNPTPSATPTPSPSTALAPTQAPSTQPALPLETSNRSPASSATPAPAASASPVSPPAPVSSPTPVPTPTPTPTRRE